MNTTPGYKISRSPRPAIRPRHLFYVMTRIGTFFLGLLILGVLALTWTSGNPVFSGPAAALALMLIAMLALQIRVRRQVRAQLVLQHLATAVQLRLPLPQYLLAASMAEAPGTAKRLRLLARYLEEGATCGTAFHLATGEMELRLAGRIDAAQETGHLATTLAQITEPRNDTPRAGAGSASIAYVLAVFLTLSAAFILIGIFVMPKFHAIMSDFHVSPPWPMQIYTSVSPVLLSLLLVLFALGALIMMTHSTRLLFSSRNMPVWYRGVIDRLRWYVPLFRSLTRDQAYSDLAWTLSGALKAGHSLDHALSVQARSGINRVLRLRLEQMRSQMLGGFDPASAANDAGFPPLLVSLLKQEAQPDLAKAMAFAGTAYSARYSRLLITLNAVVPVVLTLSFAGLATLVALSLFMPLVALIDAVAPRIAGLQ